MQYYIGTATWGYPIVWQRPEPYNGAWIGSGIDEPDQLDPMLVVNWKAWTFALWLQQNCRVDDWVYTQDGAHNHRWYIIGRIDRWCIHNTGLMSDVISLLHICAHADRSRDTVTFREGVEWQDKIRWKLYGF